MTLLMAFITTFQVAFFLLQAMREDNNRQDILIEELKARVNPHPSENVLTNSPNESKFPCKYINFKNYFFK